MIKCLSENVDKIDNYKKNILIDKIETKFD